MRVIACRCNGLINMPDPDLGQDIRIEWVDNICTLRPTIAESEKVVIAGCSPAIMEGLFPGVDAEFVNLKEHVILQNHPVSKAHALLQAAVQKTGASALLKNKIFPVRHKHVVIIGGGVAGIETARILANTGIKVTVVEKGAFLGGTVAKLDRLYPGGTPYSHTVVPLINTILQNSNVNIMLNTTLDNSTGSPGDYTLKLTQASRGVIECTECGKCIDVCPVTVNDEGRSRKAVYYAQTYPATYAIDFTACNKCGECVKVCPGKIALDDKPREHELKAGALIVATGLTSYDVAKVEEYGYGRLSGVMNTLEFERAISSGTLHPKKVVLICCAGSRDTKHLPYCSKVCCFLALKEAKLVKDRYPETMVYVVAMDMRSYGNFEYFYNKLREEGISFIKGKPSEVFRNNGSLVVRTEDLYTDELLDIEADTVVLSNGFVPDQGTFGKLAIRLDNDFPVLLQNSDLGNPELPRGIFSAGSATFPGGVTETLIDARKAACSALGFISKNTVQTRQAMAQVNSESCSTCRLCIGTCPYNALSLVEEKIKVREDLCMGCGICSATCPSSSSQLENFNPAGVIAYIKALVKPGDILAMLCRWSAYNATDAAAYERISYPENVKIMRIPCTGAVDPSWVIHALDRGAKGVLIGGCYPDACHYAKGNFRAVARDRMLKIVLDMLGYDRRKIRLEWIGKDEAKKFAAIVQGMND
ncbi:MAG TPA: FAD-dependent oxidoreductase [bacterium]